MKTKSKNEHAQLLGKQGGIARWKGSLKSDRQKIMSEVATKRWDKYRKDKLDKSE